MTTTQSGEVYNTLILTHIDFYHAHTIATVEEEEELFFYHDFPPAD